ncbi:MAG: isoprenyl transferase [Firmicutes bacterium]|nr:isoprenyl transferase [Bacillota bacterium]
MIEKLNTLPEHIAIIMDGNGRWASQKKLPRTLGHKAGVEALKEIVRYTSSIKIKILTVYAFSTENWKRPLEEVEYLINYLLIEFLKKEIDEINRNNVKIRILGDIKPLPKKTKEEIIKAVELTKNNKGLLFNIALNYGGKDELVNSFRVISEMILKKTITPTDINEKLVSKYLYTANEPDLIIRTGGEKRLSNFLIWQGAYSELYFTDVFWPDFKKENLIEAINDYNTRNRRFGGLKMEE